MSKYDITQTNAAVRRLIETTDNPRHRYMLQAYDRHRNLEMAGRWPEIFTPEMTVDHPVYHFNIFGLTSVLEGADAVKAVYQQWTETDQCIFYAEDEKLAVGDNTIVSSVWMYQQAPGSVLVESGFDVDADAWYLLKNLEHLVWPYDDEGRLIGEDVWEVDESTREFIKLEPSEVLTVAQSAKLLDPYIKPLPPRPTW
ncbi:hypothetical protein B2J88_28900 [Rhodococcus sp. SRB_17]|nr:hypothetical protein [Rhodococcus sp. SRB_17]